MPVINKGKGKGKGKGGKGGKHGGGGGKGQGNKQKPQAKAAQGKKQEKGQKKDFIPKNELNKLLSNEISVTYSEYSDKFSNYSSFFGIFTRHNHEQLKLILENTIPDISKSFDNKYFKQSQKFEKRDLNQFIFHGDVAIGAYLCTEASTKLIRLDAICVLPAFQNCGFGSRLMVKLLDSCVLRAKVQTLTVEIPKNYSKSQSFFERFGFKTIENKKDETKSEETESNTNISMECNINILRQTVMFKVKKDAKDAKDGKNKQAQQSSQNSQNKSNDNATTNK